MSSVIVEPATFFKTTMVNLQNLLALNAVLRPAIFKVMTALPI